MEMVIINICLLLPNAILAHRCFYRREWFQFSLHLLACITLAYILCLHFLNHCA